MANSTGTIVDIVSPELLLIFHTVNLSILASTISLFGILSNIINIVVFITQGMGDTMNISLFALAVSDLCSLIMLQFVNLLRNPLFIYKVPVLADEFQHLAAAWPHACFARTTSWITVYITLERCLCVAVPLKVKKIVTPKLAAYVMVSIFLLMFLTLIPDYATCYIDWKMDARHNRSMLGLMFLQGRDKMAAVSFILAAGTQISSFGAVILCTIILVININKISKWRKTATLNSDNSSLSNSKTKTNKKTVKMVILVASIYCICFLPMLSTFIAASIEPDFIIFGPYHNTFLTAWSFAFLVDSINSSINIFVYYRMSTKYRTTFNVLFCGKSK